MSTIRNGETMPKGKGKVVRKQPDPIRTERKMIHGQMVDVAIYASEYKPLDDTKATPTCSDKKSISNLGMGEATSWEG